MTFDIDTHALSFIYTKSAISCINGPTNTLSYEGTGALNVSQQMDFGNGHIWLSFGQLFEYTIEFYPSYLIFLK